MSHEWTRVRPYLDNNKLKARVVCRFCPAEKRLEFDKTWKDTGSTGVEAPCPRMGDSSGDVR